MQTSSPGHVHVAASTESIHVSRPASSSESDPSAEVQVKFQARPSRAGAPAATRRRPRPGLEACCLTRRAPPAGPESEFVAADSDGVGPRHSPSLLLIFESPFP